MMHLEIKSVSVRASSFVLHKHLLILVLLFTVGLGLRLIRIDDPPLNFHATRQYRSLIIARGLYVERVTAIPEWRREVARTNMQKQGILEPPIMEYLASIGYHLAGGERYWIPRLLSVLFWMVGGGCLYRIAQKVAGAEAALLSLGLYLFLPFGIIASRSFQPDPLMVMLILGSLYAIMRYDETPSRNRLGWVTLVSALALLVKPISLFVIFTVFLTLSVNRQGVKRSLTGFDNMIFFLGTLLPTLVFYLSGILFTGIMEIQARSSFLPQLLLTIFFYKGWLKNLAIVIGVPVFLLSMGCLLLLMLLHKRSSWLVKGMWVGYIIFCLVFNYHIATHDYYHLQLIPIVSLTVGAAAAQISARLQRNGWQGHLLGWVGMVAVIVLGLWNPVFRVQSPVQNLETQIQVAQEVGLHVDHSLDTIYLAADYGTSLEYHGELSGYPWPLLSDLAWERLAGDEVLTAQDRFEEWFSGRSPAYFIVLDMYELTQQPDLAGFLNDNFPLLVAKDTYRIYRLQPSLGDLEPVS
jgi:hypothetical protein